MDHETKVSSKVCVVGPSGDILCVDPPHVFCAPPTVYTCAPSAPTLCQCVAPTPPTPVPGCTLTISYAVENPALPTIVVPMHCGGAGVELALAVILAKLLGAP